MQKTEQAVFDVRTYAWYHGERPWAVFRTIGGVTTSLYTAATEQQCRDWLRTALHQRKLAA